MDKKTIEKLKRAQPSRADLKRLFVTTKPMEAEKRYLEQAMKHPKMSKAQARGIDKMLATGHYDKTSLEVDQKVAKEIEKKVEGNIEAMINRGDIKRYDINKDKWGQKIMSKHGAKINNKRPEQS